jgi:hypothetical protein
MGLTGETFIYELPGPDGIWRAWAHGDARLVGIDLGSLQQSLGTRFDDFWNILTGVKDGKPSEGFYRWMTGSDKEVEKYMVSVPVSGTPYVVAAVTDTDEFVRPIDLIESKAAQLSDAKGQRHCPSCRLPDFGCRHLSLRPKPYRTNPASIGRC